MKPPFNVEAGLMLERSSTLLPWGSTIEALSNLGSPEIYRHHKTTDISWTEEEVFGGLAVRVDIQGAAGPNAFYLQRNTKAISAQAEYSELLAEMTTRLGPPHFTVVEEGYPWSRWVWGNVAVSLRVAEHFTEYVALMVSRGVLRA
jgi:hypothetical protein